MVARKAREARWARRLHGSRVTRGTQGAEDVQDVWGARGAQKSRKARRVLGPRMACNSAPKVSALPNGLFLSRMFVMIALLRLPSAIATSVTALSTQKGGSEMSAHKAGAAGVLGVAENAAGARGPQVRNKGGIWVPEKDKLDPGPPCCQICTEKAYHPIALLELPEHIERAALDKFHAYQQRYRGDKRDARPPRESTMRFREKQASMVQSTRSTQSAESDQSSTSDESAGFIGTTSGGGAIAGTPESNAYGGYDILEALQHNVENAKQRGPGGEASTPPTNPNPDRMGGTMGAGPCCRICPLWFIPKNQKFYAQGDIQPEYGKALIEKAAKTRILHTSPTGASFRGVVGQGLSVCCNVCTDDYFPPSRDINEVTDITFLEVKARVQQRRTLRNTVRTFTVEHTNLHSGTILGGGCCTLCSEKATGGWSGEEPFSDPASHDQYLEQQSEDPGLMRDIADKRTWNHMSTASNQFLLAAKTIEALSKKMGGVDLGISNILRL